MNKTFINKSSRLFAAVAMPVLAFLLVSCSNEDTTADKQEAGYCSVSLRITVEGIGSTRATPAGDYDDGRPTAYENYINVIGGDYKMLLFKSDSPYQLAAEVTETSIVAVESNPTTSKTYILSGRIPSNIPDGSYKLMLLANWNARGASYPSGNTYTIDGITNGGGNVFTYSTPFELGPGGGIPMFGVVDQANIVFKKDQATNFGTIHLLRAVAKVEVKPADSGSAITAATMTRVNDKGLAAPRGIYSQDDYVKGSYKDDYLSGIHLPGNLAVMEDVPFIKQPDGSFVIYVPEYDNTSASAVKSKIHLTFSSEYSADLEFKFYDSKAALDAGKKVGDAFDIARNNWYTFTVTENGVCQVTIMPMRAVDLNMDFGFDDLFPKNFK